ncbi:MAG: hypothetical protein ABF317_03545 [Bacteroidia bacterium]
MTKYTFLLVTLLLSAIYAEAQTSFTLSADAPSLIYGGYSLEGGVNRKKMRYTFSLDNIKLPNYINADFDSIQALRQNIRLKASRFLSKKQKGFHIGVGLGFVIGEEWSLLDSAGKVNTSIPSVEQSYATVGFNVGYIYHPFKNKAFIKGFYVEPSIGATYAIGKEDLKLGLKIIEKEPMSVTPIRFSLGWRIKLP